MPVGKHFANFKAFSSVSSCENKETPHVPKIFRKKNLFIYIMPKKKAMRCGDMRPIADHHRSIEWLIRVKTGD